MSLSLFSLTKCEYGHILYFVHDVWRRHSTERAKPETMQTSRSADGGETAEARPLVLVIFQDRRVLSHTI